jgi:hypothetical protein
MCAMPAATCRARVRLSRALFRRVAARAIEEGTDPAMIVIRAVEAEVADCRRRVQGKRRTRSARKKTQRD